MEKIAGVSEISNLGKKKAIQKSIQELENERNENIENNNTSSIV